MSFSLNIESYTQKDESDKSDNLIEPFSNVENFLECETLKINKCPKELKDYPLYNNLGNKVKFPSARIIKLRNFDIGCIIITIIFFINFYFLLTTVILTYDLLMIVYCSIIYFFGIIIQVSIFPIPGRAEGIIEFREDLNKTLNCYGITGPTNKKEKINYKYPANFCTDITGCINIPKSINFVKIGKTIILADKDYKLFMKKYTTVYNNIKCFTKFYNNYEQIVIKPKTYMVNTEDNYSISGFFDIILSILLLYWIKALYYRFSTFFDCLVINPVKLISKDIIIKSPTKINIHGKILKSKEYSNIPYLTSAEENYINELEKKYEKIMEKKKEKLEKIKERKKNTFLLSDFSTNNYKLKIKREYQQVFFILEVYNCDFYLKDDLGWYDSSVRESIDEVNGIYIPNGINIKIIIKSDVRKYNIKIGSFSKTFKYD